MNRQLPLRPSDSELSTVTNLRTKHVANQGTGLLDLGYRQVTVDPLAIAVSNDDARCLEYRQMLRQVSLRNSQLRLELGSNPVTLAEAIEYPQTSRISEGFANTRLPFEDFGVWAWALPAGLGHGLSLVSGRVN